MSPYFLALAWLILILYSGLQHGKIVNLCCLKTEGREEVREKEREREIEKGRKEGREGGRKEGNVSHP